MTLFNPANTASPIRLSIRLWGVSLWQNQGSPDCTCCASVTQLMHSTERNRRCYAFKTCAIEGGDITDKPKRAIVLDDEPLVRQFIESVVSQCGYSVSSYSSPAETTIFKEPEKCPSVTGDWASFDTNPNCAELIITDMRVQFCSGLEYVTKLREVGCKVRHIAMLSGDQNTDDRLEAEALGCKVFCKPFKI